MRKPFRTYPGCKDAGGIAEWIVHHLDAHGVFVSMFAGNCGVTRKKNPALRTVVIDDDRGVVEAWRRVKFPGVEVVHGCGMQWIKDNAATLPADTLIYADPPYPHSTRSKRKLYKHEWTDAEHREFLKLAKSLPFSMAISTYPNALYERELAGWERHEREAMTRGGVKRMEVLYIRRSGGGIGRDHRFAGRDFRERERIKRKAARWVGKFVRMPEAERDAVLVALLQHRQV